MNGELASLIAPCLHGSIWLRRGDGRPARRLEIETGPQSTCAVSSSRPRGMGGLADRGFRWAPPNGWSSGKTRGNDRRAVRVAASRAMLVSLSRCLAVSLSRCPRGRGRGSFREDGRPGSDGRGGTLRCSTGVRSAGGRSGWRRCAIRWCVARGGSTGVATVESCEVLAGNNGAALGQLSGARRHARRTPRRQRRRAGRDQTVVPR